MVQSRPAKVGDRVVIHYIGTLDNGKIFDTREADSPLTITLGKQEVFPALEEQIVGMQPGQVKNLLILAEDAFGLRKDENIINLERSAFPAEKKLRIGQKISIDFTDNSSRIVQIVALADNYITVDGNHQLAGHDLTFALKLAAILD